MNFSLGLRFGNFDVSSCHWQLLNMSYLMVSVTLRNPVNSVDFQFPSAESQWGTGAWSHQDTVTGDLAAAVFDSVTKELRVRFEKPEPAAAAGKGIEAACFTLQTSCQRRSKACGITP